MEHSIIRTDAIQTSLSRCLIEHRASRAAVLGATLAFGSCTLAGCGDGGDVAKMPLLGAVSVPVRDEAIEEEPVLEIDAEEGRVATVSASPGFTPDPMTYAGTSRGNAIDAHELDDRCRGWLAAEPELVLTADRPFSELALMVASSADTSLYVLGPDDGEARCADDEDGHSPLVRELFEPGVYRVWVGTADPDETTSFVIALSELEETRPSTLTH